MNEEFAIKLKMVMDQSSIASIKEQLSAFGKETSEGVHIPPPQATEMFDVGNLDQAQEHYWEIQQILAKIADLQTTLSWDGLSSSDMIDVNAELEKLYARLKKLTSGGEEGEGGFFSFSETIVSIKNNTSEVIKRVLKLGGALLGIQTIYGSIQKAMSNYLGQNDELKNKINACWYALGSLFAPVLEFLVNLFIKFVSLVDAVARALGFAGINMDNFGKKAGKASKQLAGFDEINNLSTQSGGTSNPFGGFELGDKFKDFANLIKGNIDLLKLIGLGAMFGIGVAFLFTGHPLIGLGMILSAGVLAYKEIIPNWNYLTEKVGGTANAILAILTGFTMGLGTILMFTGHPALGLGMLITGMSVASALVDWSYLPSKIHETMSSVMAVVSTMTMGLGVILLLAGFATQNLGVVGLGLGLILGGYAVSQAKASFDTKYLSGVVDESLGNVENTVNDRMPKIEASVLGSFDNINLSSDTIWGMIKDGLSRKVEEIKENMAMKFSEIKEGVVQKWNDIKMNLSTTWESLKSSASSAFGWIANRVGSAWEDAKTKSLGKWNDIRTSLEQKWNSLKAWWQSLSLGSFRVKVPHFRVSGSFGWSWNGGISIPHISVDWYKKGGVFSGPQIIGVGEYGNAKNNPEVVAPLNTLSDMIGSNSRTDELLEQLIDIVDTKEFRAYISQNEIGKTAVKYINTQSRIKGGSIV